MAIKDTLFDIVVFAYTPFPVFTCTTEMTHFLDNSPICADYLVFLGGTVIRSCGWDGGGTNEHGAFIEKFSGKFHIANRKMGGGEGGGGIFKDVASRGGM